MSLSLCRYLYLAVPFVYPSVWMAHKPASQPKKFKVSPRRFGFALALTFADFSIFPLLFLLFFCVFFHVSRCARISAKYLPGSRANNDIPHSFCVCGKFACRGCRCCGKCKWCHWSRWGVDDVSTATEVVALAIHAGKSSTSWTVQQLHSCTAEQSCVVACAIFHGATANGLDIHMFCVCLCVCVCSMHLYVHTLIARTPNELGPWGCLEGKAKKMRQMSTGNERWRRKKSQRTAVGDRQPTTDNDWQLTTDKQQWQQPAKNEQLT